MDRNEQFEHQHGVGACAFCDGDEIAIKRQAEIEEKYQHFEEQALEFAEKGKVIFGRMREKVGAIPLGIATRIESANEVVERALLRASQRAEEVNKKHSSQGIEFDLKKATAIATASSALLSVAPATAQESPQPVVRVLPDRNVLDVQQSLQVAENLSNDPAVNRQFTPYVDEQDGNTVKLAVREEQPEKKQADEVRFKLDLSKLKDSDKATLVSIMNVDAKDQENVQIYQPKIMQLEKGQDPTDLARQLLGEELGQNKRLVYWIAHMVCSMNDIDIEKGEDRIIQPGVDLFVPYETVQKEKEVEVQEIAAESQLEEGTAPVSSEAAREVESLINSVKAVEVPKPMFDYIIDPISEPKTPVADRLEVKKDELVGAIESGETNVAYLQTEAIIDLSLEHSAVTPDVAARTMVAKVFEQAGIEPDADELEKEVGEVLLSLETNKPLDASSLIADTQKIDLDAKPISELADELNELIVDETAKLQPIAEKLDELGIEYTGVEKAAASEVKAERKDEVRGDEYYYLLLDGIEPEEKVNKVREIISGAIYEKLGAGRLVDNPNVQAKIIGSTAELLSDEYVELGSYIDNLSNEVANEVQSAKESIVPIVAEISSIFEETSQIPDEQLSGLVEEVIEGRTTDYIRMKILEYTANVAGNELDEQVDSYLLKAFESAGVSDVVSAYQRQELVDHAMLYWQSESLEKNQITLDANEVVQALYDNALAELLAATGSYLPQDLESTNMDDQSLNQLLLSYLKLNKDPSFYQFAFISNTGGATEKFLYDYYDNNDAGYYIHDDNIIEALVAKLAEDKNASPDQFVKPLAKYTGNPEEIFPDGEQYILHDYDGQDLTSFMEAAGLDSEKLLSDPLNFHISAHDGKIIAEDSVIWFTDKTILDEPRIKKAYDEQILGIKPPEQIALASEPKKQAESKAGPEKVSTNPIVASLANVKFEDKINNLDNAVAAITNWYSNFQDSDKDPAMPEGYVRVPSHEFFDDLDILFTWAEKTAKSERYGSPVTVAGTLAIAELYQQMLVEYPEYQGSMLRIRDLNSDHHVTHDNGRNVDLSTNMTAEVTAASTGPIMDFVSGDGTDNDYNFNMNVEFAVKLAGLRYQGNRAISSILSSDAKLVKEVNNRLGYHFMSEHASHSEHWHVSFRKSYALGDFEPRSTYEDLGYKGDLGIGGEYQQPTEEMHEEEHAEFEEAIEEVVEEKKVEEVKVEKSKAKEAKTESLPAGISQKQLDVSKAKNINELVTLGFPSLAKIPEADQKQFNEILAQQPTIEEALANFNYRQGDSKGPAIPATAVLAIAYDAGLRGDTLIEAATTGRGESIGFHPYVIGDDKGERSDDGKLKQFAVGLFQFFIKNGEGVSGDQLDRGDVLLNPVANILEMVEYHEDRGFKPWYFNQNKDKQPDSWKAHQDKVLIAADSLEANGLDILP